LTRLGRAGMRNADQVNERIGARNRGGI
jgi:hypothetical protein